MALVACRPTLIATTVALLIAVTSCSHPQPTPPFGEASPQQVVLAMHRTLLLAPPPPPLVPELYDFLVVLSQRTATGDVPWGWATYLYTSYYRDMVRDRSHGIPRRSREEIRAELDRNTDFFFIRHRPGEAPAPMALDGSRIVVAPSP